MLFVSRPRIAVIDLAGVIGARGGGSTALAALLQDLREDRSIRAVVLRVDSPGGSAVASDEIRLAVRRLRERTPVTAFIHGAGASGAYLAACDATRIVALSTAIVGSIGVLSVRAHAPELLKRAGVTVSVNKAGRLKDLGAFWGEETPEEQTVSQALVDDYYDHFIQVVADGRRMAPERARELATGEVFTGRRALDLGLVDALGDWDDVVRLAMRDGRMTKRRLIHVRPHVPLPLRLLGRLAGSGPGTSRSTLGVLLGSRVLYVDAGALPRYLPL